MSKPAKSTEAKNPDPATAAPEKPPESNAAPLVPSEAEKPQEGPGAVPESGPEAEALENDRPDGPEHLIDEAEFQAAIDGKVDDMLASMTDIERAAFRVSIVRSLELVDPEAEKRAAQVAAVAALVDDGAFGPRADEPRFFQVIHPGMYASEGSAHYLALGSIVGRATHPLDHILASNEIVLRPVPVS